MSNQPSHSEIELLRTAYSAFNGRHIEAALATMTSDVSWPRAFKGGFVEGHRAVGAYWTEQWSEINPHVEPEAFHVEEAGHILVKVHQGLPRDPGRDRRGINARLFPASVLGAARVRHRDGAGTGKYLD